MSNHSEYIKTPITSLLDEAIAILSNMEWNMRSFAIAEYILHSLFLKMTGAQEQKFKCLVWEIGSLDLEFRKDQIFDKKWEYGECSKTEIIKALYNCIKKHQWNKDEIIISQNDRDGIFECGKEHIKDLYERALKASVYHREYNDFCRIWNTKIMPTDSFCMENNGQLMTLKSRENYSTKDRDNIITFKDVYDNLYYFRNLCAHNFKAFQTNHFDFNRMRKAVDVANNYFFMFAALIVIDEIVTSFYKKLESLINTDI